eukprot:gnl/TRDRNA2_/TRDRNA2_182205_c0_seq1.p1 gnl/TRDRNA2_/TRDRNA2_182205_c0~~gnl/TRDRNA2_/TRDRNA2_182205_c0_seq1.p1  ORF type:complete len:548 (-),score=70.12 gnl/TRDRNA2_/TRDRNA2_182205_c0_seq1:74-1717(-)
MKQFNLILQVVICCLTPCVSLKHEGQSRLAGARSSSSEGAQAGIDKRVISLRNTSRLTDNTSISLSRQGVQNTSGSSNGTFNASEKREGWPRDATLFDESLEYTFRGDDFLPNAQWMSKPRVNGCKNVSSLTPEEASECDLLELQFSVVTPSLETDFHYGRDYVHPYPDDEQVKKLHDGPFRDLIPRAGKNLARVTFIVHGYLSPGTYDPGEWEGLLARELVNGTSGTDAAIVIDWRRGAHAVWGDCHGWECLDDYPVAMADARVVGKYIQRLAAGVREVAGEVWIGCVGHSVGSHVCGFASKYMSQEELPGGKLRMSRISALDPAGPSHSLITSLHSAVGGGSFVDAEYELARLNSSDAEFVDVYISDPGGFGYDITLAVDNAWRDKVTQADLLGHTTFLINGHHYWERDDLQPGCESRAVKRGCSHHVAIDSYMKTVVARNDALAEAAKETPFIEVVWDSAVAYIRSIETTLLGGPPPSDAKDYCEGIKMQKPLERCKLPFPISGAGHGSRCPHAEKKNATYGVCAGHLQPEGLFIAPLGLESAE